MLISIVVICFLKRKHRRLRKEQQAQALYIASSELGGESSAVEKLLFLSLSICFPLPAFLQSPQLVDSVAGGGGHVYSMPELKTPLVSREGQHFSLAFSNSQKQSQIFSLP